MAEQSDSGQTPGAGQTQSSQYWQAWSDAARKTFAGAAETGAAASTSWQEGLEQWQRLVSSEAVQATQQATMERLLTGARSYFALLQTLSERHGSGASDAAAGSDAVRDSFNFAGADAALFDNPLARALRELVGQGAQGFEQLLQTPSPAMAEASAWLGLPALGFAREHQQRRQQAAQAWLDCQRETNRYNALIARASRRAFTVFEAKLAARGEAGNPVDSVRGLYDLWVDAAEDAYAEVALSDEFRSVYGALVNAQMRVRQGVQQDVERTAAALGMPTRSEIDSMGKRLQALRRESMARAEQWPALLAEIAALRGEVEALKSAGGMAASAARPPRKPRDAAAKE